MPYNNQSSKELTIPTITYSHNNILPKHQQVQPCKIIHHTLKTALKCKPALQPNPPQLFKVLNNTTKRPLSPDEAILLGIKPPTKQKHGLTVTLLIGPALLETPQWNHLIRNLSVNQANHIHSINKQIETALTKTVEHYIFSSIESKPNQLELNPRVIAIDLLEEYESGLNQRIEKITNCRSILTNMFKKREFWYRTSNITPQLIMATRSVHTVIHNPNSSPDIPTASL